MSAYFSFKHPIWTNNVVKDVLCNMRVHSRKGIIEQVNVRAAEHGASEAHSLPLATWQVDALQGRREKTYHTTRSKQQLWVFMALTPSDTWMPNETRDAEENNPLRVRDRNGTPLNLCSLPNFQSASNLEPECTSCFIRFWRELLKCRTIKRKTIYKDTECKRSKDGCSTWTSSTFLTSRTPPYIHPPAWMTSPI